MERHLAPAVRILVTGSVLKLHDLTYWSEIIVYTAANTAIRDFALASGGGSQLVPQEIALPQEKLLYRVTPDTSHEQQLIQPHREILLQRLPEQVGVARDVDDI